MAVTKPSWTPSSWRSHSALHQPDWPSEERAEAARARLASVPPLVFAGEARQLRSVLAEALEGRAFLLQAGECAESFHDLSAVHIREKLKIMLQMAAADLFGQPNYQKFDELTVSLSHPDAMLALMNNTSGVNAHFATSPFYEQEMKFPNARVLTTSYDILGGLDSLAEVCDAGTRVIVIGRHNAMLLYRELTRRGVSDYLTPTRSSTRPSWPRKRKPSTPSTRTRRRPRRTISTLRRTGRIRSTTSSP